MNVKRITRLISLLRTLQSGQAQNADVLADKCGMSRRTVFRDIESLKEAGVPVEFDSGKQQYRIDGAHFLPPTNLTLEEALSVVAIAQQADASEQSSIVAAASDAAAKLISGLPLSVREHLETVAETVVMRPSPANPLVAKGDIYRTLLDASVERRVVRVKYNCLTEFQEFTTEIHPYQLLFQERSWYVIGHSNRHDEVRTFNISRIDEAEKLDEPFERPEAFSLKKHFRNAWRFIPDEGPDQVVHLRFSKLVARNVSEVIWHSTQRCERADDGTLDFYATVSGLGEIMWWILGYGDQVEVVKPARLRRMVGRRLAAAAARYAGDV